MQPLHRRRLRRACLALGLALVALPPLAADEQLTLMEAQRRAVERSRQLDAIGLGVEAARERAAAAGELPDPVLSIGIENLPIEGSGRFSLTREAMTMRRIGVMQELTRGDKRRLREERYRLEADKGLVEQQAASAEIRRDTALAWIDAWYAQAMAALVAELRVRGLQEVKGAEAEYRAGRGSQAEVFMTRGILAMLDDRAAALERRVQTARTVLARWTGGPEAQPLGPRPDIATLDPRAHGGEDVLERHPDIEVLAREEAIAEAQARLAAANRRPDWSVELAYSLRGSFYGDMVSLGVKVPLPWDRANRQDRETAARRALALRAAALREEAVRSHLAEVRAMTLEWDSNRRRLMRFEDEIIPLAEGRVQAAEAAYRGGRSNVTEVLAARRGALDARLQALELEAETARLWARINFLAVESVQ